MRVVVLNIAIHLQDGGNTKILSEWHLRIPRSSASRNAGYRGGVSSLKICFHDSPKDSSARAQSTSSREHCWLESVPVPEMSKVMNIPEKLPVCSSIDPEISKFFSFIHA
jgi:hypothetical protein